MPRPRKAPSPIVTADETAVATVKELLPSLTGWQETHIVRPYLARRSDGHPQHLLHYVELVKGLGKSTLMATLLVTESLLRPGLRSYLAAADAEQAAILLQMCAECIGREPSLKRTTKIRGAKVVFGNGSAIQVLSADAPSAHGLGALGCGVRFVCDEIHAWPDRTLFDILLASTGKQPDSKLLAITNVGPSKAGLWWAVRRLALKHHHAYIPGPTVRPEWVDAHQRAQWERAMELALPESEFARYIKGTVIDGADTFIPRHAIESCVDPAWTPQATSPLAVFAACDLGLTRDRTAIAAVAWDGPQLALLRLVVMDPQQTAGGQVLLGAVERELLALREGFENLRVVRLDPWTLAGSRQKLEGTLPIEEFPYVTSAQEQVSARLFRLLSTHTLRLFPHAGLLEELAGLQLRITQKGFCFDHRRAGYSDMAVALGMACHAAVAAGPPWASEGESIWLGPGREELTFPWMDVAYGGVYSGHPLIQDRAPLHREAMFAIKEAGTLGERGDVDPLDDSSGYSDDA